MKQCRGEPSSYTQTDRSAALCKSKPRISTRGAKKYAPKHDNKSKEAKDVDNDHNTFHERQFSVEHGVGEDSQE